VINLPADSDRPLVYSNRFVPIFRRPVYAWLGLRPAAAQHTAAEHAAFRRCAEGRKAIVEIGVAEGVSALALREVIGPDGTLFLVDPFHLSRFQALNFTKRTARRVVGSSQRGEVVWLEQFSSDAVKTWNKPIDLLVIDGDHAESMVQNDWDEWSRFVEWGGLVAFHDARLFEGGWTTPEYGPVRVVNRMFRGSATPPWKIVEEVDSLVVVKRGS